MHHNIKELLSELTRFKIWVDHESRRSVYTDEILPEELEKFVCIRISKIMGDYSIH